MILFTPLRNGSLFRVPAAGGEPVQVTELEASRGETAHLHPRFLPDGVHFLYLVQSLKPENAGIYVGSLNSKMTKRLLASTDKPEFAAPDLVLFLRDSTLMAQRLDVDRIELAGEPYQVAEQVAAGVTASQTGVLAYTSDASGGGRVLTWIDRSGKIEGTVGSPAFYENPGTG